MSEEIEKEQRQLRARLPRIRINARKSVVHLTLSEDHRQSLCGALDGGPIVVVNKKPTCLRCVEIVVTIQSARKERPMKAFPPEA